MTVYQLLVKTNSYAGNFEREMCAFMTGHIGECTVGEELVDREIEERFDGKISGASDDHGCFRPVALGDDLNDFIIFLEEKLSEEDLQFLNERAKLFEKERPYKYLDKKFKYLGLEQYKVETRVKKTKI